MGDSRITEIKKKWLQLYSSTYSDFTPYWGAAEQKLTKSKVLPIADVNKLEMLAIYEAMGRYLEDDDGFLSENRHHYRFFCQSAEKYLVTKKKPSGANSERHRPMPEHVDQVVAKRMHDPVTPSDQQIVDMITKDPVKFLKGLKQTYRLGKMINAKLTERVLFLTVDTLGRDRAKKIWLETEKFVDI